MAKAKNVLIIIGIAIIFAFFVGYGINVFVEQPQYNDFCDREIMPRMPDSIDIHQNATACEEIEGAVYENGYCNTTYECQKAYDAADESYTRLVFIITAIIGLAIILFAVYGVANESVSVGLIGGSLLILIYGTMVFWRHAQDLLRFLLLGVVLAVLIWVAYKKLK